jgi:site-specific DNA-cytosine methylase
VDRDSHIERTTSAYAFFEGGKKAKVSADKVVAGKISTMCSKTVEKSWLHQTARQFLNKLTEKDFNTLTSHVVDRDFVIATGCSGSGMAEICHLAIHDLFEQPTHVAFTCEKMRFKRDFCKATSEPSFSKTPCQYDDLGSLSTGRAECLTHKAPCSLSRDIDLLIIGFSCKDLSKLNPSRAGAASKILQTSEGSTNQTFRGTLDLTARIRPRAIILENVDGIAANGEGDEDESDDIGNFELQHVYCTFAEIGYTLSHSRLLTADYGLPQRRSRTFFAGLNTTTFGMTPSHAKTLLELIFKTAEALKSDLTPLEQFLYTNDTEAVVTELKRRTAAGRDDKSAGGKWQNDHAKMFTSAGLSWRDRCAPADLLSNPWFNTLTSREQENLIFQLKMHAADKDGPDGGSTKALRRCFVICGVCFGRTPDWL